MTKSPSRSPSKSPSRSQRSYDEGCLAAHALDLIGDRWALLVVRELMLGPRRFGEIRAGLPGIATNVLTQRLEALAATGLALRRDPPEGARQIWGLTPAGAALWPVLAALCRWGVMQPGHDPRRFISPTALLLSMKALARPRPQPLCAGFTIGGEIFTGTLGPEGFAPARSAAPLGAPVFHAPTGNALAAVIYGPGPVAALAKGVAVRIDGAGAQDFVDHFSLRPPSPTERTDR